MVASGSNPPSSSISIQEKGSGNNRQSRADPPLNDPDNPSLSNNTSTICESSPTEKSFTTLDHEQHQDTETPVVSGDAPDVYGTLYGPREELDLVEFQDPGWSDINEIEELVLSHLDTILKNAIKRITSHGSIEEVTFNVVSQSQYSSANNDTISYLADFLLLSLWKCKKLDSSLEDGYSEPLQKFVVDKAVFELQKIHPSFSTGDALWLLLLCAKDFRQIQNLSSNMVNDVNSGGTNVPQLKPANRSIRNRCPGKEIQVASSDSVVGESNSATLSQNYPSEHKSENTVSSVSTLPMVNSVSLPSNSTGGGTQKPNCSVEAPNSSDDINSLSDKCLEQWISYLDFRKQKLQAKLQEWEEWRNQKVIQAVRRLQEDNTELQTLRKEKEDMLKRIEDEMSDMSGQIEEANATVHRLEIENSELRQKKEASKLHAEKESALLSRGILLGERETSKQLESLQREVARFREELVTEKHKLSQLQQRYEQAKEYHAQLEANWRQEQKLKEEALAKAESEREERERKEVSAKSKDIPNAERSLKIYKERIKNLEDQIIELKLAKDSSKIAAVYPESIGFTESGTVDVQCDSVCLTCTSKEGPAVAFMPCCHQILCTECNYIHEDEGYKMCPTCHTIVQWRMHVRYADT